MAASAKRIKGLVASLIVVLGMSSSAGAESSAIAHPTAPPHTLAQDPAPIYPPDAPPQRRAPLPDRRQDTEEQTLDTDYRVGALQPDSQGTLWVGSWQGLAKISPSTGVILSRVSLPNTTIGAIAQDHSGRIWVGTYEGLVRLDPKTGTITAQNFALPSNRVLSMIVDQRGFLWVGTDAGLAMISPDRGFLKTTIKNLPGVSANTLALDKLGNLWVGTLEGLVQINTANAFVMRRVTDLPGTTVQTLSASPWGTLWIGTPTDLLEANIGIRREVRMVPVGTPATTKLTHPRTAKTRKPAKLTAKKPAKTAKVNPPKLHQQVVFVANDTPQAVTLRTVSRLHGRNITSLEFDQVSSLWVGTTTGLLRINPYNGVSGGEIPNLPSSRILAIASDTGGKLWVGTSEGLGWVNTQTFQGHPHQTFQRVNP